MEQSRFNAKRPPWPAIRPSANNSDRIAHRQTRKHSQPRNTNQSPLKPAELMYAIRTILISQNATIKHSRTNGTRISWASISERCRMAALLDAISQPISPHRYHKNACIFDESDESGISDQRFPSASLSPSISIVPVWDSLAACILDATPTIISVSPSDPQIHWGTTWAEKSRGFRSCSLCLPIEWGVFSLLVRLILSSLNQRYTVVIGGAAMG